MAEPDVHVRPRRPTDLPALGEALMAQQPETRYPFRDPLPVPVAHFLHGHDALAAWTAEVDGRPSGHVCRVGAGRAFRDAEVVNRICADALGCAPDELSWVSSLFVAREARGLGLGRLLLDAVVDDCAAHGLGPCLEVLPTHSAALALYEATGWRTVHRFRPDWLRAAAGHEGPDVQVMVLGQGRSATSSLTERRRPV